MAALRSARNFTAIRDVLTFMLATSLANDVNPVFGDTLSGSPMRVAIADNDNQCRYRTRSLLADEGGVEIVAECMHALEIPDALHVHQPDLLLVEPQIPGSPLEFVTSLRSRSLPLVIFTSALDQYALKAFDARVFDYILKPFNPERFHGAIERARVNVSRCRQDCSGARQLIVKCGGGAIFIDFDEIDWIEAAANYVLIHAGMQVYRLREAIGHIEKRICHRNFARIHRSIIVNVAKLREVRPCNSCEYMVRLKNGKELACSRHYNLAIRRLLRGVEPAEGGTGLES